FNNLLTNAAKYTEPGGRIRLIANNESPGYATIRVEDTGIGISSEALPRIFELFAQIDDSLDRSQGGLGIGRTLVRSLVELHGGQVVAESAGIGKGSCFTVRLPLAHERASSGAPALQVGERCGRQLRVLVVEDNVDTAAGLSELLREVGHAVQVLHDGEA